jgi:hypothetical protein
MELRQEVYNKIAKDYSDYIDELKTKDVDYVIDKSYETSIKDEMTYLFDPGSEYYSDEQLKALNKSKHPLEDIYSDWISNDFSIGDSLRDSVDEYLHSEIEYQKNHKEINER